MANNIDDITIEYSENEQVLVKELDKSILSKGAWTTIIFKYKDFDRKQNDFGKIKFSIRRYQKRDGEYIPKSKFNISSIDQATKLVAILQTWL